VAEVPGMGQLVAGFKEDVYGLDGNNRLWHYDCVSGRLERAAVRLPEGKWYETPVRWARDDRSGILYITDGNGNIFRFSGLDGFSAPVARTTLLPVGPMAVTHDGRLFGWCGETLSRLFCYEPRGGTIKDLGAAASVIERRRYGYVFGSSAVGRDGEIYFGEDDDLGHLWIYFPAIRVSGHDT